MGPTGDGEGGETDDGAFGGCPASLERARELRLIERIAEALGRPVADFLAPEDGAGRDAVADGPGDDRGG